jgi:hypothetical protein
MSTPNPFVPAGSLIAERQRRNRTQFKVAVYAVLAAHAMLVLGLLIQGCKTDTPAQTTEPVVSATPAPIPKPRANPIPPTARGDLIYVVMSGDTVNRIAKTHGTTVQALRTANGLKNDRLVVGMKLRIPPTPG